MSIRLNSIKVEIGHDSRDELKNKILKALRIPAERLEAFKPAKISIDARKKNDIKNIYSFDVDIKDEAAFLKKYKGNDVVPLVIKEYDPFPNFRVKELKEDERPVIIGFGPAGMFCALFLAEKGLKPIVIERGEDADARIKSVNDFWNGGKLNTSSNVQFGEGGAGTFSDGKLNTLIKDPTGRIKKVYSTFVENGANESIMYVNKPHIGTDKLVNIVKNIRERIISLGGEVRFNTKLSGIDITDGKVKGIYVVDSSSNDSVKYISCKRLVLAIGHSARDTFEMLLNAGVHMEQKPFAMGVRVQHPQELISRSQYGDFYDKLPPADYKVTANLPDGRGVYSFCMCPGGFVVNASSEEGHLAVNGMSNSKRDEASANSAIVVSVNTSDFPGADPLAGMRMQRELERKAFECCNGKIPVEQLGSFMSDKVQNTEKTKNSEEHINAETFKETEETKSTEDNKDIEACNDTEEFQSTKKKSENNYPNIKGQWEYAKLDFLPDFISDSIREAFPEFGRMINGFDDENSLLIGLESRTSSPVRINRDEKLQAINIEGLYPCGEGAGYAGGITSAAVDGLKVFEEIISEMDE